MGKKSTRKLVGRIASALEWEPKTITEISEEVDADRRSVVKYLEALSNAPNIKEYEDCGKDSSRMFGKAKISNKQEVQEA